MRRTHWLLPICLLCLGIMRVFGQSSTGTPLTKSALVEALKIGGLSQDEVVQIVKRRGVDFVPDYKTDSELKAAGASSDLLFAVAGSYRGGPATPARPEINSLRDVHKIYISKMGAGLDEQLKIQIAKRLSGRVSIVLDRVAADAVLASDKPDSVDAANQVVTLTDPTSRIVLWSGNAGDRNKLLLDMKHGGTKMVAARLAAQLHKAFE